MLRREELYIHPTVNTYRSAGDAGTRRKGRGALSNPAGRFQEESATAFDDGWDLEDDETPPRLDTEVRPDPARRIIARNRSPDLGFEQSINPYRGCEHGCIYCYARPSHAYLDLSPGLDFETRLFFKKDASALLEQELARAGYRPRTIALGSNTDPYQPVERELRVTRSILEVLERCAHPVGIVTKSALVERDLDLLSAMARRHLASVVISVTTLDEDLKRVMEPRTASPKRRLRTIRVLSEAGIPTGVLVAPIIPRINDSEIESILEACREAGADTANYTLVRLPHELKDLFVEWLDTHFPERAEHVMSLIRQCRGGRDNDPRFGHRLRGTGVYADLIARRFATAAKRLGFRKERRERDCRGFVPPRPKTNQLGLFD